MRNLLLSIVIYGCGLLIIQDCKAQNNSKFRYYKFDKVFCKKVLHKKYAKTAIDDTDLKNWINGTLIPEWFEHDNIELTDYNTKSLTSRLMYISFNDCELFEQYYYAFIENTVESNDLTQYQHLAFSMDFQFLIKRAYRVLPEKYKALDKMKTFKSNLKKFDWVLGMHTKYVAKDTYEVSFSYVDPSGKLQFTKGEELLMTATMKYKNGEITSFSYSENESNIKLARTNRDQIFGTPPPPLPR